MSDLPTAITKPKKLWSWVGFIPIFALIVSGGLIYWGIKEQGTPIKILFKEGHGLKVGDKLRYRGIDVGEVSQIKLTDDAKTIEVLVKLTSSTEIIARSGSLFWIARPQINLRNISGLDTLLGANYLQVLPSSEGQAQDFFVGLEQPPLKNLLEPGGLEIILLAKNIGALQRGAPISYRQVTIGTITEVDLAKDASAVIALAYIKPKYVSLIRENTQFWRSSAVSFDAGWLRGISVELASVQALLGGGVNVAIPETNTGEKVLSKHRFTLYDEPEPEWLNWTPYLPLEELKPSQDLPIGEILTASLVWEEGSIWTLDIRQKARPLLMLPVEQGFLSSSLLIPRNARADKTYLNIANLQINLETADIFSQNGLSLLKINHDYQVWQFYRLPLVPEDTFVYVNRDEPRFVAAHHYKQAENHWQLEGNANFDYSWHGAVVVSVKDGYMLGVLLLNEEPKVSFWITD